MAEQKMPRKGLRVHDVGTLYGLVADDAPDVVRYVGFTTKPVSYRLNWHRKATGRPIVMAVTAWIAELAARGVGVHTVVLKTGATYEDEFQEVTRRRAAGEDLLNKTSGGVGLRGMEPTAAMRAVYALPASDKQRAFAASLKYTLDHAAIAEKNRKHWADPAVRQEHGANVAAALKARMTPELYAARSAKRLATMARNKALKPK